METTDRSDGAVKLWLRDGPMPSNRADVVGFLLDEARRTNAFWAERYPYVWPIRRVGGPQLRIPSDDVRRCVTQACEGFMERCQRLRKQYRLPLPSDGDDKG